ncbi:autophagy-related protein 17 [Gongronella butleri]|nr:autophagy-related protein 17 [Gongronella butleri]
MDDKLIELLIAAKKALLTGQAICEQANALSHDSEQAADAIEKTWPRIVFVHNHILVQLTTLHRIREFLVANSQAKRATLKEREATFAKVSFDLQEIFATLRSSEIDPNILQLSRAPDTLPSHAKRTLFDYIQDEAVLEFQQLADDEIGKVEILCSSLENSEKQLSTKISELASMLETAVSISLDDSTANFVSTKTQIQESEMATMADILNSLTNHYDQLGEATRLWRSNLETGQQLDISVLQDDNDHLPDILEDLKESLEIVSSVKEELDVRLKVLQTVQDELLKVLDHLDVINIAGGVADTILERMSQVDAESAEHESHMDHYFDQLTSLTGWYQQFILSYHHLVLEVNRRQKVAYQQEQLRQELMQSLKNAYEGEVQKRQDWVTEHGQFLPEDLCAFIFDPPAKLTVHKDNEVRVLPEIPEEAIQTAMHKVNKT